jgi:voltage-gated potassium channel
MERANAYVSRADPVMVLLSLIFLVVFTGIVVWQDMPPGLRVVCWVLQAVIWVAFVTDLVIRVRFADRPVRWLASHPLDVLAVLWPALRPLKILAVIGETRFRSGQAVVRTTRAVIIASLLLIWVCSVAVLSAERGQVDSSIETIGDALWWAFVTFATVGYGDVVPVTAAGRAIGIVLMVVGLGLVAVITASVASWFVANTRGATDEAEVSRDSDARDRLIELERKIDQLIAAQVERDNPQRPPG